MDRRTKGEENYRKKFSEFCLDEKFEFIRRDWTSDHGRKMFVKCKACGSEFLIWDEVFKGRQKYLLCKECGISSGEKVVKARSPLVDEALKYYVSGHSVLETASAFGFTKVDINNWVKRRGLTNGRDWQQAGTLAWSKKAASLFASCKSYKYFKKNSHRGRAIKFGCEYDPSVNLKRLIKRDGLRCALCGGMCDINDNKWKNGIGPLYPTIDHIIPMAKKGGHVWSNVQIAHAICNYRKGARLEVGA